MGFFVVGFFLCVCCCFLWVFCRFFLNNLLMQNLKKCLADFHKNVGAAKPLVNLVIYLVMFFKSHYKSFKNEDFNLFATA